MIFCDVHCRWYVHDDHTDDCIITPVELITHRTDVSWSVIRCNEANLTSTCYNGP